MLLTPMLAILALVLSAGFASAVPGGTTIGGCLYTGSGTIDYNQNGPDVTMPLITANYVGTPAIANGQVKVQNQHNGGAFVAYGTMGLMPGTFLPGPGGNCWEAVIPSTLVPGTPDVTDLVAVYSAPGHDVTSREWTWDPDGRYAVAGEFMHPTGPDAGAGGTTRVVPDTGNPILDGPLAGQTIPTSVNAIGPQNAYLPQLTVDTTGNGVADSLATGNLLHYVFYDEFANGNPNGPTIEAPIKGVEVCITHEAGIHSECRFTGDVASITTLDGVLYNAPQSNGLVYFTNIPSGVYSVVSNADAVTRLPDNGQLHLDDATRATRTPMWYQTFTEAGGHAWDAFIRPGDPGTMGGGYLTFHAFFENLGSDAGGLPGFAGIITGSIMDADAPEPLPQLNGGRVPPTNARYEDGTPWDINTNIGNCDPLLETCIPNPGPSNQDIVMNGAVPDVVLALYSTGDFPTLVATTEASNPTEFNSPTGADFAFTNVNPGQYEMFIFDEPLKNVPETGIGVTVTALTETNMGNVLMPRFGSRLTGFVLNGSVPVVNARVKTTVAQGDVSWDVPTNGNGYFLNDFMGETMQLASTYVDIITGDTIRGKIITENFQQMQCGGPIVCDKLDPNQASGMLITPTVPPVQGVITTATHNAMNRQVGWGTFNYFLDIQVENIPAGEGYVIGNVFNDNLNVADRIGNNVWDEATEALRQGVTVNLVDAAGAVAATAVTGVTNKSEAQMLGWVKPGSIPVVAAEIGAVIAGPITCATCVQTAGTPAPMPGFYEFRGVTPGTYRLEMVAEPGFTTPYGKFFTSLNGNGIGLNVVNADGTPYTATVRDEDILFYDGTNYHMFFDGSLAGLPGNADIDALHVVDEDTFYVSFAGATTLQTTAIPAGVTSLAFVADDEDVVLYNAGDWSLYFDGGLNSLADNNGEDLSSLAILDDGRMVFSVRGSANANNATTNANPLPVNPAGIWTGINPRPQDEDLLVFDPATGYFDLYFDGSDIALHNGPDQLTGGTNNLDNNNEDVWGTAIAPNGDIYLTTAYTKVNGVFVNDYATNALTGTGYDVFACRGAVTGRVSSCLTQETFYTGSALNGFSDVNHETLDAVSLYGLGLGDDVVVLAGTASRVDLATSTINTAGGRLSGVPLAGELEGGIFQGTGVLDPNLTSNWFDESIAMNGAAMGMYDSNGYFLGVFFNGDPWCNWLNDGNATYPCSTTHPDFLSQSAESERRFAPGVQRTIGNDPAFAVSNVPAYLGGPLLDSWFNTFESMELNFGFGQNTLLPETAWTPLVAATIIEPVAICANVIAGTAFDNGDGTWAATAEITAIIAGGLPVPGADIQGAWNPSGGGAVDNCTTSVGAPYSCLTSVGTVTPAGAPETVFTVADVTGPTGVGWEGFTWVYDPAMAGCNDAVTVLTPLTGGGGGAVVATPLASVNLGEKWEAVLSITGTAANTDWSIDGSEVQTTGIPAQVNWVIETGACSVPYSVNAGFLTGTIHAPAGFVGNTGVCPGP